MLNEISQPLGGSGSDIVVSAPGKVILFGEHSVVYGRLALAGSLGLRTRVRISNISQPNTLEIDCPNFQSKLRVNLEALNERLLNPLLPTNLTPTEFSWETPGILHHETLLDRVNEFFNELSMSGCGESHPSRVITVKSMLYLIAGMLGSVNVELKPIAIVVNTDLDMGAGTGSSASFLVCITAALLQYIKLNRRSENISKTGYKESNPDVSDTKNFSKEELDLICNWAFCAERIVHGTPSGLDNTICTYGSLVEFRKGLEPKLLSVNSPFKILLINTKVPRETKHLVAGVAHRHNRFPDLMNNILNAMEDVAYIALQNIINIGELQVAGGDLPTQDCYDTLGTMVSMNHSLLCALGVSHPRLDEAVAVLAHHGLTGKLTGAGGGGYAIALLRPGIDGPEALVGAVAELTLKGFGVECTELGGEGVRVENAGY